MGKLYFFTNEFADHTLGGVGTVVNQQVEALRARGVDAVVVVWPNTRTFDKESIEAQGGIVVQRPSEIIRLVPRSAVVIDHLWPDHPVRRLYHNRLQYEHGLRGGVYGDERYPERRYNDTRGIICVSKSEHDEFCARYPRLAAHTSLVYNGFSASGRKPQTKSHLKADIGYVGRMAPMKRFWFVSEAAASLEITLRAAYATIDQKLPESTSHHLVYKNLDRQALQKHIWNHIGLLCLPSSYEPFGMVLLEAMSQGIPVLAANTGGMADIIQDDSGLLFESSGISKKAAYENFLAALQHWTQMSADARLTLGRKATQRAALFSSGAMVDRLLFVLHERCTGTSFLPKPKSKSPLYATT